MRDLLLQLTGWIDLMCCWPLRQHKVEGEGRVWGGGSGGRALRFLQEEAQRCHSGEWGRRSGCFLLSDAGSRPPSTSPARGFGGGCGLRFCRPPAWHWGPRRSPAKVGDIYTTSTTSSQQTTATQAGGAAVRSSEVVLLRQTENVAEWILKFTLSLLEPWSEDIMEPVKEMKERHSCRI